MHMESVYSFKVEYLSFEKTKEIVTTGNLWAEKEIKDFYTQMEELDTDAKFMG